MEMLKEINTAMYLKITHLKSNLRSPGPMSYIVYESKIEPERHTSIM